MSLLSTSSLLPAINSPAAVLGVPFILALISLQVECRLPPQLVVMRAIEKSLYGDKRINLDHSLSRKEAYRGRRRRKRRPSPNSFHSYGGYYKKSRNRPRRPPPVQEYADEFEDIGDEGGYTEDSPIRTRPWSNHLYSAAIKTREPPRSFSEFNRYRSKKPRPPKIGGYYHSREPEDLDNRWNEFRDDYPPRQEWELDEPGWEYDRPRIPTREDYIRYSGKNTAWRDTRDGPQRLRPQSIKNIQYNVDSREPLQTQQMPVYQVWSDEGGSQDDIEVQVKYPVWMDEQKSEDWPEVLYPGQRVKQIYQDSNIRVGKLRPAINQDLEAHIIQPSKSKTKYRSGIGQNIRGQTKEINWELGNQYQNVKTSDMGWDEPKPFENPDLQWKEQKSTLFPWNANKKSSPKNKDEQWDEKNVFKKDYAWSDASSTSNQDYWTDTTTVSSQSYPHWDSSQQYYHDRSLRQQSVVQSKMDPEDEDDHSSNDKNKRKAIGTQK